MRVLPPSLRPFHGAPVRSRSCRSRRGTACIELAVLLPLLLLLFVISVDYGRIFYFSVKVENCARSGAIYGSDSIAAAQSTYGSIQEAALAEAPNLTPAPTVTSASGTDSSGYAYVEVTAVWTFQSVSNFLGAQGTTTLTRTVRMRVAPITPK